MSDAEDKTAEQLAAEINSSQTEQVDTTAEVSQPSATAPATNGELILGKFKTHAELEASYVELERNFTASRQAKKDPVPTPTVQAAQFDQETEVGIQSIVERKLAEKEAREEAARVKRFADTHAEELKDPLLRATVSQEIREANERGEFMDQEVALTRAKAALEERLAPKVAEASKAGVEEGKALARRKEQAGAIGTTTTKAQEVDPETLTAEEYAEYMGLERSY